MHHHKRISSLFEYWKITKVYFNRVMSSSVCDAGSAKQSIKEIESFKANEDASAKQNLVPGPKRKAAMSIAYCGENYHGMAMNRGQRHIKTIEGDLITALVKAKVVPENCWDDPNKMTYKIASRTDKGVSTCGQVASLKLIVHDDVVNLINKELPADITVLAVRRATKGFSAQFCADSRTYSYTLPTYAFADPKEISNSYLITPDKLEHIATISNRYKGTHSYHNFTSGKRMGEMSAQRYIIDFYHEPPFLQESVQFMTFKLKGQSFMLHQIRKMIGLMIAIVSGYAKEGYFDTAFSEPLVDIPKAPGTGLVLERVHYQAYNKKHGHLHGGVDFSDVDDKVEEFRQNRILPYIYRSEVEQSSMMDWLVTLPNHDFTGVRAREDWEKQNALVCGWLGNAEIDHEETQFVTKRKAKEAERLLEEETDTCKESQSTASKIVRGDIETSADSKAGLSNNRSTCLESLADQPLVKKCKVDEVKVDLLS